MASMQDIARELIYSTPDMEVVAVGVERGFDASGGTLENIGGETEETKW